MRHATRPRSSGPCRGRPLQEIDLDTVPVNGETHKNSLFMEDTAWPFEGGLQAYLAKAGTLYDHTLSSQKEEGIGMIELEAAFQPVFGTHQTTEVILWQRVVNTKAVMWMLGHDLPPGGVGPGHLAARRPGGARPLGEPAAAQRGVVAAVLSSDDRRRRALRPGAHLRAPGAGLHRDPAARLRVVEPSTSRPTAAGSPATGRKGGSSASLRRTRPGTAGNGTRPEKSSSTCSRAGSTSCRRSTAPTTWWRCDRATP